MARVIILDKLLRLGRIPTSLHNLKKEKTMNELDIKIKIVSKLYFDLSSSVADICTCFCLRMSAKGVGVVGADIDKFLDEYREFSGANEFCAGFYPYEEDEWEALLLPRKRAIRLEKVLSYLNHLEARNYESTKS